MNDHIQLIIARYREDIAWADETGYDYVVYDKSGQPVANAVPLPNIGREGHSYLTHIVRGERWTSCGPWLRTLRTRAFPSAVSPGFA